MILMGCFHEDGSNGGRVIEEAYYERYQARTIRNTGNFGTLTRIETLGIT
jgi:hypothetical protein